MLGVTCHQQWTEHITNDTLRKFGMATGLKSTLIEWHMRWLGHVCRMLSTAKTDFTYELIKSRAFCYDTKQHWREVVNVDLKILNVATKCQLVAILCQPGILLQ